VTEHYFSGTPETPSDPFEVEVRALGHTLRLQSDRGVFSGKRLDTGSRLLIETVRPVDGEVVLDFGCGLGILGILAALTTSAQVYLIDVNQRAASLALNNTFLAGVAPRCQVLCADGASCLAEGSVDLVLLNPPIRAGRDVVRRLIADSARVLREGGRLALVALTRQGAESLARVIAEELAPPELVARGSGYRVYTARKAASPSGT
jgi:16S rRNA (guanine1207-N2)-methyltransferase